MTESKVFTDNFSRSFTESGDFFQFLSDRKARSKWMTAPSRELQFEPVERGSTLGNLYMQIYDHNGVAEILEDTMENTSLLLKVDEEYNLRRHQYLTASTPLLAYQKADRKDAETEARIKRLVESLSVASETSAKYVMEQIDELHRQSEQEQTRIAELEKLARQSNALSQNLFFYRDMIESFADTVDSTTIEERRRLLRTIVKKVVWDGKNVYVYLFAEDGELNLPPIGQLMCPSGEDSE